MRPGLTWAACRSSCRPAWHRPSPCPPPTSLYQRGPGRAAPSSPTRAASFSAQNLVPCWVSRLVRIDACWSFTHCRSATGRSRSAVFSSSLAIGLRQALVPALVDDQQRRLRQIVGVDHVLDVLVRSPSTGSRRADCRRRRPRPAGWRRRSPTTRSGRSTRPRPTTICSITGFFGMRIFRPWRSASVCTHLFLVNNLRKSLVKPPMMRTEPDSFSTRLFSSSRYGPGTQQSLVAQQVGRTAVQVGQHQHVERGRELGHVVRSDGRHLQRADLHLLRHVLLAAHDAAVEVLDRRSRPWSSWRCARRSRARTCRRPGRRTALREIDAEARVGGVRRGRG